MKLIDGQVCAQLLLKNLEPMVVSFQEKYQRSPRLKIIRISDDFGSVVYTERKIKVANSIGVAADIAILPKDIAENKVVEKIRLFNQDDTVDGIILQLPLPEHLSKFVLLDEISPDKDVDGVTKNSMGSLMMGAPIFMPCTPQGIIRLAKSIALDIRGLNIVILGQSLIVGRPVAMALLNMGATVIVCHSATKDLEAKIATADVLISAMGATGVVNPAWIKAGAVVFDVAINRNASNKVVGDIDRKACEHVGYITPVPGGVGPMTVACLQFNTLLAALKKEKDSDMLRQLSLI